MEPHVRRGGTGVHGPGTPLPFYIRSKQLISYPRRRHIRLRDDHTPGNVLYCYYFLFSLTDHQVLTGQQPYYGLQLSEIGFLVENGGRPDKPVNAEDIGISDPLWKLVRSCWDGNKIRRPQIQEVVAGVDHAAANWCTDMPPSGTIQQEYPIIEANSASSEDCEFIPFSGSYRLSSGLLYRLHIPLE